MKITSIAGILGTDREVDCPTPGACTSLRLLVASDGLGFSMHKTIIPKGEVQHWHYKNHLEACYCIEGRGSLVDLATGSRYLIVPDTLYALDEHDRHTFQALEDVVLISVFNPPVTGREVHDENGSYSLEEE